MVALLRDGGLVSMHASVSPRKNASDWQMSGSIMTNLEVQRGAFCTNWNAAWALLSLECVDSSTSVERRDSTPNSDPLGISEMGLEATIAREVLRNRLCTKCATRCT